MALIEGDNKKKEKTEIRSENIERQTEPPKSTFSSVLQTLTFEYCDSPSSLFLVILLN